MALYYQGDGTCTDVCGETSRATRSRLTVIAHRIGGYFSGALRSWLKVGKDKRSLSKLSDHDLRDLGLSRDDLGIASTMPIAAGRLPDPHYLAGDRQSDYEVRRSIPGR